MTRSMADGEGGNAAAVISAGTQLVGVYVTGDPPVPWSRADQIAAINAGKILVAIDQGAAGSPVYSANVMDVEPTAFRPAQVPGWTARCTAPRPTVYCDRSDLPLVLGTGWRGDLWLAFPGWTDGQPLPSAPGCTYVAVQTTDNVGGTHDLSVVLDPYWPLEAPPVNIPGKPGDWIGQPTIWSNPDGSLVWLGVSSADGYAYLMTAAPGGQWSAPVKV